MDVAARAEIAAGAGDHDGLHLRRVDEIAKGVAQLGVAFEGERVLPLGPVERDRRDAASEAPQEIGGREGVGVHDVSPPLMAIAWPLIERLSGRQSQATAAATSAASIILPCGLAAVSEARASSSLRPVLARMLATARVTISVST